jgi:hypothetical protein
VAALVLGASLAAGACGSDPVRESRIVAPPYGLPPGWHEENERKIQAAEAALQWKLEPSSPTLSAATRASWRLRVTVTNTGTEAALVMGHLSHIEVDGQVSNELRQALSEAAEKASWGDLAPGQSARCELVVGALLPEASGVHEIVARMRTREAWRVRVEVTGK